MEPGFIHGLAIGIIIGGLVTTTASIYTARKSINKLRKQIDQLKKSGKL